MRAQRSNLVDSAPRWLEIAASPCGLLAMTRFHYVRVRARFDSTRPALALDQPAYLNSGNFFSASWVAPGNLILLPDSSSTRL